MTFITNSPNETEDIGRRLSEFLFEKGERKAFIALYGDMGVGKTAFTRGFASALSLCGVKSPTYTIVNEYRNGRLHVFHFDMYRIEDEDDLTSIGFYDYLEKDGYCICEWSENIISEIPSDAISVTIKKTQKTDEEREIIIEGGDLLEDFIA